MNEGPKGLIHKLIQFAPTNLKDVYNLSFGDKDHTTGKINDTSISKNEDSEKVLAMVVASVYAFTDKSPDVWVYATGSTKSRTRLYRMGITKYYTGVKKEFEVYGEAGDDWEFFDKDKDYDGF